jgi:hypothetical protein
MPHHMLQLLVRSQALLGKGLLGLPALQGWWRQQLAQPAAAAAGSDAVAAAAGAHGIGADGGSAEVAAGRCCSPCSVEWLGQSQLLAHLM